MSSSGLGMYVPLAELARHLGRPVRIALLERRSRHDDDTKSMEVQHNAHRQYLHGLPPGSYVCDLRLAEDGGDVYRQIVSAWKGDGKHKLLRRIRRDENTRPMQLFHVSISYLALLSVAIVVDVFI